MAYDGTSFNFVQMLREALTPPKPEDTRTCNCPIVFEEDPNMVMQVHRYDCHVSPSRTLGETHD